MMIKSNYKLTFLSLIIYLMGTQTLLAIDIKTSLDRNPVSLNESVQLTFTVAESPDGTPDFSPLKKDFEILNQTQSSNSLWVNGKSKESIQWVLKLMPKKSGELQIPTISFGNDSSHATKLTVTKNKTIHNKQSAELFLEVEATPASPYLQSQVLYTLRLFSRVQVSQARLTELELTDALVEKLGETKRYETTRDGFEYTVTELNYAVFPQKSGVTTIKPLVLTADVVSSSKPRYNGFFRRQISKTQRISSNAITLDVKAVPQTFKGKRWLPASQLVLEEKWSGETDQMKVGEPLTRTLTLLAVGNTVAQLPELHQETGVDHLKTYPDQPVLKEQKKADGLIAFREEKIAYIPSKDGRYTLPAIEVPWFNTQTQTMEVARIAERTITAIGTAPLNNNPIIETPVPPKESDIHSTAPIPVAANHTENKFWMWMSIFLGSGWLLTLVYLFSQRKPKINPQLELANIKETKLKEIVSSLKQACKENNPDSAKDALLAWGKINYDSDSLSSIARHCEARLKEEILSLNQHLYTNHDEAWLGKKLFQTFTENKARKQLAEKADDALEPLYKI